MMCKSNNMLYQGAEAEVSGKQQRLLDVAKKFYQFTSAMYGEYLLLISAILKTDAL